MNITKIKIGRLHNLGNYEHIRYELTAEVPTGESPATALIGMEKILNALDPKCPANVPSESDIASAANRITCLKAMSEDDYKAQYGYHGDNVPAAERLATMEKQLAEGIERCEKWKRSQAHARKLLEDLGGAANYTDAKDNWGDDY